MRLDEINGFWPMLRRAVAEGSAAASIFKQTGKLLYRGVHYVGPDVAEFATPATRKPLNSDPGMQKAVDDKLRASGFIALRSNSIFCTTRKQRAALYGNIDNGVYIIFPLNGFSCTYSLTIDDFFSDVIEPSHTIEQMSAQDFIYTFNFRKDNLIQAMDSHNEIYIHGRYIQFSIHYEEQILQFLDESL